MRTTSQDWQNYASTLSSYAYYSDASVRDTAGRWSNTLHTGVDITSQQLNMTADNTSINHPIFLKNLRLQKFQTTFSIKRLDTSNASVCVGLGFNGSDQDDFDTVYIYHANTAAAPTGYSMVNGTVSPVTGTQTVGNVPALASTDTLWVQATFDGSTLTVKLQNSATEPTSASWSSVSTCYTSINFRTTGGLLGFIGGIVGTPSIGTVKVWSYDTGTSAFDIMEQYEPFATDGSGFTTDDSLTNDNNGNLTFDGTQAYTYDAWNRLITIAHAYRDSSGTLQHGQTSSAMGYDALGRRIFKAISNTGNWDCTYNYYLDGPSVVEEQNGSAETIKQYLWGLEYIDELVQTSLKSSPTTQSTCDTPYWACQDANWNVLGIANSSGAIQERYEYTPYGQRQVFISPGTNDPMVMAPLFASSRFITSGSVSQPYGICEVGHQGLMHDEESGLIYNRARYTQPVLGRSMSREPFGGLYIDGMNLYQYELSNPVNFDDPDGLQAATQPTSQPCCCCCVDKLTIQNIQKIINLPQYGHSFDVSIDLSYQQKPGGDCKLIWKEKSNRYPPFLLAAGVKENQWNDMTALYPQTPVFDPFRNRTKPCPGKETTTLTDTPIANANLPKRVLEFEITVESGKDCPCAHASLVVKAVQTLEPDGKGGIKVQEFKVQ